MTSLPVRSEEAQRDGSRAAGHVLDDDEAALVARIRSGDVAAFETVFRRYFDGLADFACALVPTDAEAEEIAQDVLTGIWATRATWDVRSTLASYLYGAVRNRALDAARRTARAHRWAERVVRESDGAGGDGVSAVSPLRGDERLVALELVELVRATVAGLPERCRTTYLLSRQYGLTYPEIATTMGTTLATVNTQMSRAFAALREAVARWRG